MVIKGKEYLMNADYPNSYFIEGDALIEDETELANKVIAYYPYFKLIKDENNNVIDVQDDVEQRNLDNRLSEIAELKQKLFDTDYQAIKYAEGYLSIEEYQEMKLLRQSWRDRINELESEGS